MLIAATGYINGNEKAGSLQEVHLQSPDSKGQRRYRILIVKRDGRLAEYREDMGEAKLFKGIKQINIPALFEHTVDELIEMAEAARNDTFIDLKDLLSLETYKAG